VGFDILLKMADRIGVPALWPSWGHASDVPELLEMLLSYEVLFMGPLAQPMDMLGDFNQQLRHILEVFYSMINCPLQPSLSSMRGSLVLNTPRVPLCFIMLEIQVLCICSVTGNPNQADNASSLTTQVQHAIM
jgi:hypothetical protein